MRNRFHWIARANQALALVRLRIVGRQRTSEDKMRWGLELVRRCPCGCGD